MELIQGARSKLEARQIRQSLRQLRFRILPLSDARGIQLADALIAATAIETDHPLCTANVKHFRPMGGLSPVAFRP